MWLWRVKAILEWERQRLLVDHFLVSLHSTTTFTVDLLIGFGIPFIVATAREQTLQLPFPFSTSLRILVAYLLSSLVFTLAMLPIQRFRLRRIFSGALIAIYVSFLVLVVLSETRVIKW